MLKAISFFIGLSSKHAWACWDSARIIDFEFPTLTRVKWTLSQIARPRSFQRPDKIPDEMLFTCELTRTGYDTLYDMHLSWM